MLHAVLGATYSIHTFDPGAGGCNTCGRTKCNGTDSFTCLRSLMLLHLRHVVDCA